MQYRRLGSTGLEVSAVGIGGVPLSCTRRRPREAESIRLLHHAVELGVTLIDTADSYCLDDTEMGHNERLIGKALQQLPSSTCERVVVATKGGWIRPNGAWIPHGPPQYLRERCEESLRNLQVECIDLYQHHTPDANVPVTDSVGELHRLREEGKIRHIGVSNYSVAQLDAVCERTEVASVQNQYSPLHREPEQDGMLSATADRGLAFLPWSPLGGLGRAGSLAELAPALAGLAATREVSVHRLALAWLLAQGEHVLPIPGVSRIESLEDSVAAAELDLSAEELAQVSASAA